MSAWMLTDEHADFLATAYVRLIDPAADPQVIGRALLMENHTSLAARYGTNDFSQGEAYRFREWLAPLDPAWIITAADCAECQCCEHTDWQASTTAARLAELVAATRAILMPAERKQARYDEAPWGIESHHRPGTRAALNHAQIVQLRAISPMRPPAGRTHDVDGLALFDTARQLRLL